MSDEEPMDFLTSERRMNGGRPKANPSWQYCELLNEDGRKHLVCTVPGCKATIKGDNICNFERHVMRNHPDTFTIIQMEKKALNDAKTKEEPPSKKRKVSVLNGVRLSMEDVVNGCISIVAESGRPFSCIDDPGFQRIIKPTVEAVPERERRAISSFTVREMVQTKAEDIRKKLREELSNRMLSIKVDSASRGTRTFLGINVQYIDNGRIVLRTLALKEMHVRSTATNLKGVILDVLWENNIPVRNLFSFTSDNGSNMVLAGQLLQDLAEHAGLDGEFESRTERRSTDTDTVRPSFSAGVNENVTSLSDDDGEESDDPLELPVDDLESEVDEVSDSLMDCCLQDMDLKVTCVRCAAHSLQLAVMDAMKSVARVRPLLAIMRKLCKALRTKNVAMMLRNMKENTPCLDNETRWHSTHDMLASLISLRDFCVKFGDGANLPKVTDEKWKNVEELVEALQPAKLTTKKLPEEQLLIGDFYGAWLTCKMQTKNVGSTFALHLAAAMDRREKNLMANDAFVSAIYMDPRFFSLLGSEACTQAETHLVKLWTRLEDMQATPNKVPLDHSEGKGNDSANMQPENTLDELEELLAAGDEQRIVSSGGGARINILPKLKWFRAQPRLRPVSADLLKFWQSKRFEIPELNALAMVVLAVPATQVSVERLFSGMKFVLSDLRFNLTSEAMDNLMKIRQYALWTRRCCESARSHHASTGESVAQPSGTSQTQRVSTSSSVTDARDVEDDVASLPPKDFPGVLNSSSSSLSGRSTPSSTSIHRNKVLSLSSSISNPGSPASTTSFL